MGLLLIAISCFFIFDLGQYLSFDYLKSSQETFKDYYQDNKFTTILSFFLLYVLVTSLSLPGAAVMTLAGGALFGFLTGLIVISFASTIGATIAFLTARFLIGDSIQKKYGHKLEDINKGVEKEGAFYLFSLRLVPLFPFFLVNLLMGITKIPTVKYFTVSQIGMLPGTAAFVYAGTEIGKLDSLSGILSPSLLLAFTILGILPMITNKILGIIKANKIYSKYDEPKSFDYNLVVIGGGSAGLVSSYIASAVKAKVALIERDKMGGDCLNTGCVPSKALIKSAKVMSYINRSKEYGIDVSGIKVDFKSVINRVHKVIEKIEPHDSIERYTKLGVDCITGDAKILDPFRVEVNGKTITAKNIIVATGAKPFVPPIKNIDKIEYHTSDTIWSIDKLPKNMVVLGGGPIGCELAQAFAKLGSKVTLIEMADEIMGREDSDVSKLIRKKFEADGVNVLTSHKAEEFGTAAKQKYITCDHNGKEVKVKFDLVMVAIGRKARIEGFGLEELGVELSDRGTVIANDFLQTNFPNIYVCGDVTGPYQFTHVAAHQAWYASVNALFGSVKKFKVDYRVIPWCTFTDPEVARVGLNEEDAIAKDIEYDVTTYGIDDLDRAIADGEDHGFVKVITPKKSDKILGVTIVGAQAGDLIAEFVLAMKYNIGLNKILGTIHIYPTMAEANKYVAGNWKKANKPEWALELIEKFHKFMRG